MVRSKVQRFIDPIVTNLVLGVFSLSMLYPILYSLMTSFKLKKDVLTIPPTFFPPTWTIDGYIQVLRSDLLTRYIPNSAINSIVSTVVTVVFAALAGYYFSRYKSKANRVLLLIILGLTMIPGVTNLVSYYKIGSELKILSTHLIIICVFTALQTPFSIWMLKGFFDAIPIELEEAAKIDGCGGIRALWHVIIPLSIPGLFATFLLVLVDNWNDFLFSVVLLAKNDARTAMVGLYDFQTTFDISYHALNAASIMIMIPMVIIFLFGRKIFFQAMLEGALKG